MRTVADFLQALTPSQCLTLAAGDYLFRQHDITQGVFVVMEGRIKLLRDTIDGNLSILHIAQAYDSLAEASLFTSHYHCHAQADTHSLVNLYEKAMILNLLSSNNAMALSFIEVLAKQIQTLRLIIELRGIRSPRDRLVQFIKLNMNSDNTLTIESTYKDLAVKLGMSHETLYRVLSQLKKDNIVSAENNKIIFIV